MVDGRERPLKLGSSGCIKSAALGGAGDSVFFSKCLVAAGSTSCWYLISGDLYWKNVQCTTLNTFLNRNEKEERLKTPDS